MTNNTGQKLEELAQFIRETLPQPKAIVNLQILNPPGVVTFHWHHREYLVKPSMEVFEIKRKDIFITGASMLIQSTLMKKRKTNTVLEAASETLRQVEDFLKGNQTEKGFALLDSVKKALSNLGAKPFGSSAVAAQAR